MAHATLNIQRALLMVLVLCAPLHALGQAGNGYGPCAPEGKAIAAQSREATMHCATASPMLLLEHAHF